jgi:hypothetical protein
MTGLESKLHDATVLTFEGLAFAFPSARMPEREEAAEFEAGMEVTFHGSFDGRLLLGVSGRVLDSLAANMLGGELADEGARTDALGELANVVCGNVLTQVAGRDRTFLLDHPRRLEAAALRSPTGGHVTRIRVALEDGYADLVLVLENLPESALEADAA